LPCPASASSSPFSLNPQLALKTDLESSIGSQEAEKRSFTGIQPPAAAAAAAELPGKESRGGLGSYPHKIDASESNGDVNFTKFGL